VSKYFIEDRAKELDDRDKFLEALVEKYNVRCAQPCARVPAPALCSPCCGPVKPTDLAVQRSQPQARAVLPGPAAGPRSPAPPSRSGRRSPRRTRSQ
jgi:hypothetical protein